MSRSLTYITLLSTFVAHVSSQIGCHFIGLRPALLQLVSRPCHLTFSQFRVIFPDGLERGLNGSGIHRARNAVLFARFVTVTTARPLLVRRPDDERWEQRRTWVRTSLFSGDCSCVRRRSRRPEERVDSPATLGVAVGFVAHMRPSPVGVSHAEPTLWLFLERNLLRHSVLSGHFNFVSGDSNRAGERGPRHNSLLTGHRPRQQA
jgi:hypothetical protein